MITTEQTPLGTFYKIPHFDAGFYSLELAQKYCQLAQNATKDFGLHIDFTATIWYVDVLSWNQYGYREARTEPPEWCPYYLAIAQKLTPYIEKAKLQLIIDDITEDLSNYWIIDTANPWIMPSCTNIHIKNKSYRLEYINSVFNQSVRLQTGTIDAWRYYKNTGEAVQPNWVSDDRLMQYQSNGKAKQVYKRCPANFD